MHTRIFPIYLMFVICTLCGCHAYTFIAPAPYAPTTDSDRVDIGVHHSLYGNGFYASVSPKNHLSFGLTGDVQVDKMVQCTSIEPGIALYTKIKPAFTIGLYTGYAYADHQLDANCIIRENGICESHLIYALCRNK